MSGFEPPPNVQYQTYPDPSNPYGTNPQQQYQQEGSYDSYSRPSASSVSSDHYSGYNASAQGGYADSPGPVPPTAGSYIPSRSSTPTYTESGAGHGGMKTTEPYVSAFASL